MKDDRLNIRISEEDKEKLRMLSEADERSMAEWVVRIIRKEFKKHFGKEQGLYGNN